MQRKSTDDLQKELQTAPNLETFLSENRDEMQSVSFRDYLSDLLRQYKVSKANLAKLSEMSEVYIHQIFSGKRNPSRNRTICIAFALSLTLEETQELLRRAGHATLYPRFHRDATIIYGLTNRMSLAEINDLLYREDEAALF